MYKKCLRALFLYLTNKVYGKLNLIKRPLCCSITLKGIILDFHNSMWGGLQMNNENIDIFTNMRVIENYKAFLLSSVADLFSTMAKGNKSGIDEIIDEILNAKYLFLKYITFHNPSLSTLLLFH
jgi:hypothetical protein